MARSQVYFIVYLILITEHLATKLKIKKYGFRMDWDSAVNSALIMIPFNSWVRGILDVRTVSAE